MYNAVVNNTQNIFGCEGLNTPRYVEERGVWNVFGLRGLTAVKNLVFLFIARRPDPFGLNSMQLRKWYHAVEILLVSKLAYQRWKFLSYIAHFQSSEHGRHNIIRSSNKWVFFSRINNIDKIRSFECRGCFLYVFTYPTVDGTVVECGSNGD
jgi:hypothetical protein